MPRQRSHRVFPLLILLSLSAVAFAGCVQENPQDVGNVPACDEAGTEEARGSLTFNIPPKESPGGNFSVQIRAVNQGNCTVTVTPQPMTIGFINATGVLLEGRAFNVTDTVEVRPGEGQPIANILIQAPQEPGTYTVKAELHELGWNGTAPPIMVDPAPARGSSEPLRDADLEETRTDPGEQGA